LTFFNIIISNTPYYNIGRLAGMNRDYAISIVFFAGMNSGATITSVPLALVVGIVMPTHFFTGLKPGATISSVPMALDVSTNVLTLFISPA